MPFVTTCSGCQKKLRVQDAMVGKRIKCPGCGVVFVALEGSPKEGVESSGYGEPPEGETPVKTKPIVSDHPSPDDENSPSEIVVNSSTRPVRPSEEDWEEDDQEMPRTRPRGRVQVLDNGDDEEDQERPLRRVKKKKGSALKWVLLGCGGLAFIGIAALAVLIFVVINYANRGIPESDWKEYTSPAGHYKVTMPGIPEEATQNLPGQAMPLEAANVIIRFPDIGFSVKYFDPPGGIPDFASGTFLNNLKTGVASDFPGGKLSKEEPVSIGGAPGRQYTVDMTKGTAKERVAVHKGRVFILVVVAADMEKNAAAVQKFFDSFRYTD